MFRQCIYMYISLYSDIRADTDTVRNAHKTFSYRFGKSCDGASMGADCPSFPSFPFFLEASRISYFPVSVGSFLLTLFTLFTLLCSFLPLPSHKNSYQSRLTSCFSLLSTTLVYPLYRVSVFLSWLHLFFLLWASRRLLSCQTEWKTCLTMVLSIPPARRPQYPSLERIATDKSPLLHVLSHRSHDRTASEQLVNPKRVSTPSSTPVTQS